MNWNTFGFVILIVLILIIYLYNSLVTLRQRVKNSWAQVDVQLKMRYDLIPNLVNTVKGYATHERETLDNVVKSRVAAVSANTVDEQGGAESMLSSALGRLLAVAENYPDLKADQNFRKLQEELSNTESKIAFSRQFYNDTVQKYNIGIQKFPNNIFAGIFGFTEQKYFNLDANVSERNAVKVSLNQ